MGKLDYHKGYSMDGDFESVEQCVEAARSWMLNMTLQVNDSNIGYVLFGTQHKLILIYTCLWNNTLSPDIWQ